MFWHPANKKNDVIGGTQVTILEMLPTQGSGTHRIRTAMIPTGNKPTSSANAYEIHTLPLVTSSALIQRTHQSTNNNSLCIQI